MGFLNPRLSMKGTSSPSSKSLVASSSNMVVAVKGEEFSLNGLTHSKNWPVGFGPSGDLIIRDQGGEHWDCVDGISPIPLNVSPDGADDFFPDPFL